MTDDRTPPGDPDDQVEGATEEQPERWWRKDPEEPMPRRPVSKPGGPLPSRPVDRGGRRPWEPPPPGERVFDAPASGGTLAGGQRAQAPDDGGVAAWWSGAQAGRDEAPEPAWPAGQAADEPGAADRADLWRERPAAERNAPERPRRGGERGGPGPALGEPAEPGAFGRAAAQGTQSGDLWPPEDSVARPAARPEGRPEDSVARPAARPEVRPEDAPARPSEARPDARPGWDSPGARRAPGFGEGQSPSRSRGRAQESAPVAPATPAEFEPARPAAAEPEGGRPWHQEWSPPPGAAGARGPGGDQAPVHAMAAVVWAPGAVGGLILALGWARGTAALITAGALVCLLGFVAAVVINLMEKDPEIRFNAVQSACFDVVVAAVAFVITTLASVTLLQSILFLALQIAYAGLRVVVGLAALRGRRVKLPVIGDLAELRANRPPSR